MAEVDGEGMLIDIDRGTSHFLNETALLIYKMVREGRSRQEIKDAFLREYDVGEDDAENDIGDFLTLLESKAVSCEKRNT